MEINGHAQSGWEQYPLPLDNIDKIDFSKGCRPGLPAFYRFTFEADELADTFLDFAGWGKGCAFVNGVNIGRFWEIGPQKRLYIPAPLLHKGGNEIILFDSVGNAGECFAVCAVPFIGEKAAL